MLSYLPQKIVHVVYVSFSFVCSWKPHFSSKIIHLPSFIINKLVWGTEEDSKWDGHGALIAAVSAPSPACLCDSTCEYVWVTGNQSPLCLLACSWTACVCVHVTRFSRVIITVSLRLCVRHLRLIRLVPIMKLTDTLLHVSIISKPRWVIRNREKEGLINSNSNIHIFRLLLHLYTRCALLGCVYIIYGSSTSCYSAGWIFSSDVNVKLV